MDEVSQKMLGLALGSGAYRGVAHLGVLKAFEEEGLKPGLLSGTSSPHSFPGKACFEKGIG